MQTFFQRWISAVLVLSVILALLPAPAARAAGRICYVKADATGAGNGTSWADAYTTLQDALADNGCTEIWVAAGVYYPDEGAGQTDDDRNSTFQLRSGVAIYGGFAGTETARDQRDPEHNITVLSGDIDHETRPDTTDAHGVVMDPNNIQGNNAYHVLTGSGAYNGTILDGVIITAGQANGNYPNSVGGGMYNNRGDPTLRDVTFAGNLAYDGGGIYNNNSTPTLTHITFSNNSANRSGGGMYIWGGNPTLVDVTFGSNSAHNGAGGGVYSIESSPKLTDVTFSDNSAYEGGGMYNDSGNPILIGVSFSGNSAEITDGGGMYNFWGNPTLREVIFTNNSAYYGGGGLFNNDGRLFLINVTFSDNSALYEDGGGIYNYSYHRSPVLKNVTFSGNSAYGNGGGFYTYSGNYDSSPVLTNVTFSDNSANNGGGIFNGGNSTPTLTNVIIANSPSGGDCANDSNATISTDSGHNLIEDSAHACGLTDGVNGNIIGKDPQLGALTDFGGPGRQVLPLKSGSPAIDAGEDNNCPSADQRGVSRPQGSHCDIGAYEANHTPIAVTVNQAATQPDPANKSPVHFTAVFTPFVDPATFDASDITLGGTAPGTLSATVTEISPYNHTTFDIAVSGMTGTGTVTASIAANRVADWEGNPNTASTSTDNTVTYDTTAPTVSITTTASDPTNTSPIPITITFSEAVTGFDVSDLVVGNGTAGNFTAVSASQYTADITPNGDGQVTVDIPAGAAQDAAGNDNAAAPQFAITYDSTAPTMVSTSLASAYTQGFTSFQVRFSEAVSDPPGNTNPNDVTNPANYLLVERGHNGAFDTVSCAGGVQADDSQIPVNSVTYDSDTFTATVHINNGVPLPDGTYRLFVCGTTSITDLAGNHLNGGHDAIYDFVVHRAVPPKTGFPRGVVTALPQQPAAKAYAGLDMRLTIPSLGLDLPIVGVPLTEDGWDVSWLGNAVGWLEGTAFPTWAGNTVLTAHVWNADNTPGPFVHLKDLRYGDRIEIHAWGQVYVYEVRENKRLPAQSWAARHMLLKHEKYDVLTLVTCEGYDPATGDYPFRRMVRAVLVAVR